MRPLITVFVLLFGLVFVLSSCSDSADTNKPNDGGNSGNDSGSSGDAQITINGSNSFTTKDNFFCYDSSDHSFRLLLQKDSSFNFSLVLFHRELKTGTSFYPADSGWWAMSGVGTRAFPYFDTLQFTITTIDLTAKTFSAVFSLHFSPGLTGITSIDSVRITDAHFVIVPYAAKPTFGFTFQGKSFSPSGPLKLITNISVMNFENVIQALVGDPNKGGYRQFRLTFPKDYISGSYPLPGWVQLSYFMRDYDSTHFTFIDSSYHANTSTPGVLAITSYDKAHRLISGTFNAMLFNDNARTFNPLTDGFFTNVFLEPQ